MKRHLRELLPPSTEQQEQFESTLSMSHAQPSEERFQRFMGTVAASRSVALLKQGAYVPGSVRALVEVLGCALSLEQAAIGRAAGAHRGTWRKVLSGEVDPCRVQPLVYGRLARLYGIGVSALEQAITGSYQEFLAHRVDADARFARSSRRSRTRDGFAEQMATAFEELRAKSAARRLSALGDEKINRYLADVRAWMSSN
jgi:hypothetical protein